MRQGQSLPGDTFAQVAVVTGPASHAGPVFCCDVSAS